MKKFHLIRSILCLTVMTISLLYTAQEGEKEEKQVSQKESFKKSFQNLSRRIRELEQQVKALKNLKKKNSSQSPSKEDVSERAYFTDQLLEDSQTPSLPDENSGMAQYNQALSLFDKREYKKALSSFFSVIRDYPNSALSKGCYVFIGQCYLLDTKISQSLDDREDTLHHAANAFLKALSLEISETLCIKSWMGLAKVYFELKNPEKALIYINKIPYKKLKKEEQEETLLLRKNIEKISPKKSPAPPPKDAPDNALKSAEVSL